MQIFASFFAIIYSKDVFFGIIYYLCSHLSTYIRIFDMNVLELSEQEIGRRQSLQELRSMGNCRPYDEPSCDG